MKNLKLFAGCYFNSQLRFFLALGILASALVGQAQTRTRIGSIFETLNGNGQSSSSEITYYTGDFYPEIKGKIKSIGSTEITYYTGDFYPEIKGKLKSIGKLELSYYTGDFYPEIKGRIKSIDKIDISYYTGDFYPEIKGKVQTIGKARISYHTGDFYPEIKGKVKSIDGPISELIILFFPELRYID